METNELLLAAEVRKLAERIRNSRWTAFVAAADIRQDQGKNPAQFQQMKDRWELEHPVAHYIPDATAQLKNVALQLKSIVRKD
jgi:hypothetical protein